MFCDDFKMRLYILICILLLHSAVQVVSNVCPDLLLEYQSRCFAECPEGTKRIAGSNNCTEACPEFAPIIFAHTCMDYCPIGYSISSSSRKSCVKTEQPHKNLQSTTVPYEGCPSSFHCDSDRPFCYKLQCLKHCPPGTKILNLQCVDICPENKPYIFNQTCKISCPLTHRFMTNNICSSSCAKGLKTYESTCVVHCPQETFSLKSQCVPTCPRTSPFILTIKNTSSCHEQCPVYTAVNSMKCELSCPPDKPYLFNRTCFASCPVDHPYLMNKESEYNYLALCLGFCPEDRVIDGISCVRKCTNDMVIFNKTCVHNCPSSKPVVSLTYECVKECSENEYVYQSKCFRNCPSSLKIFDSTCVEDCRNTTKPFTIYSDSKAKCTVKCPIYSDNFKCVNMCPISRLFTFNNTCNEACVDPYPYYRLLMYTATCLKNCDKGEYLYNNQCVTYCPYNLKLFKVKCVDDCKTTSNQMEYYRRCVPHCPNNMMNSSFKCVYHCPTNSKYVLNKTCYRVCPASHPYMKSAAGSIECLTKCDKFRFINSSYCLDTCPKGTFHYNNTCVYQCPKELPFNTMDRTCVNSCELYLNQTCVQNCPPGMCKYNQSCIPANDNNLIYSFEEEGRYVDVCVNSCPQKTIKFGISCVDSCPMGYFNFNGLCRKTCPSSHPYKDVSSQHLCAKACPKGMMNINFYCVYHCPTNSKYVLNKTCYRVCPASHPYMKSAAGNIECLTKCDKFRFINSSYCLDTCPKGTFHYNNTCVYQCPKEFSFKTMDKTCVSRCELYFNKSCIQNCPPGMCKYDHSCMPANDTNLIYSVKDEEGKDVRVCVNSCPSKTIKFNNSCVVSCPKPYVYFSGSCRKTCPSSHPYKDVSGHSSAVCVKKCPKGTVNNVDQCRKSCPFDRPLIFNNTCVTHCPNQFRYHENSICKSKCDHHQYVNKNECVSSCPFDRILNANKVCYSECPPEYPYKLYMQCVSVCEGNYVILRNTSECITDVECVFLRRLKIENQVCVEHCSVNTVFYQEDFRCITFTNTERSLSVAAIISLPVIAVIGYIFCNGNCKRGRICTKRYYKPLPIDEDETCVMEIYNDNDTYTDTAKDECDHDENIELQIDEPTAYLTEDIAMEEP